MDPSLPPHLAERFRWLVRPEATARGPGEYVLYWMHNALRAHENPALDVAICFARQNGLPLLVYHGLSERYSFASDRLHAFMLQGHRDVQRELRDRGIAALFHLERAGHRDPHLKTLADASAVLVTEEMPVEPVAGWIERLAVRTRVPIALVDSSCVVPVNLVDRAFTQTAQYRDATGELYATRIPRAYADQPHDCLPHDDSPPFASLDLQDADLADLIANCRIDHSVAPTAETRGGSRAGYQRWDEFRSRGLSQYASPRNRPEDRDMVSRLSAYMHFGMVSPFRIARQAHAAGATKFLDELLVWREMTFHFCFHHVDRIDTLEALPEWARATLAEHASDDRLRDASWETLARGKTGQPLWDTCQRGLLKHGELHDDVRKTWGKGFLPQTSSPQRALRMTLDLNYRYALDGRDPSSYGGVLWCFGQFDRPFPPDRPVYGLVRRRDTRSHQHHINMDKFTSEVDRPISDRIPSVAIIGAGLGGLAAGRTLNDHAIPVQLFEKSRGPGGRLSTRRADDGLTFDHGAQYFTARDGRFCRHVQSWIHDGLVQPWLGRIVELARGGRVVDSKYGTPRYVGVPGMNTIAKHLAAELPIRVRTQIERLDRDGERWQLIDTEGTRHGPFDVVVVNAPPVQASALLGGHTPIAETIQKVVMNPCWAVMLRAEGLEDLPFEGAFINEGPLSWIARNDAKPGRTGGPGSAWILHASPTWSRDHLEDEKESVARDLTAAFESIAGASVDQILHRVAHRWRYSIAENPLDCEQLYDTRVGLGACGDWLSGGRVEGAFLSGIAAAGAVLREATIDRPAAGLSRT